MEAQPREIKLYLTNEEESPFQEWVNSLRDFKARARIQTRLDRMESGNLGDFKPVGEGVLELRIDYGPGYRVYFAEMGGLIVLLLCGGDKSTQDRDILMAKQYWKEFQQRS